jgi:enoyl-CoA hydratase/carnithine racemase
MRVRCQDTVSSVWRARFEPDTDDGDVTVTAGGMGELLALLARAEEAPSCRVIVLEATGSSFCRGMDLDGVARGGEDPADGVRLYAECLSALRHSSRLVIAVVDGDALGGGVGLAAAADILLATRRAVFGLPEVMVGLIPAMVLPVLFERIPPQKARRLAVGAASISADRAHELGLVDELVDDGAEVERALRPLLRNALRTSPAAVSALKRFTAEVAPMGCREGIEAGRAHTTTSLSQPEVLSGIRAFVAGEPLPWQERYRPSGTEPS